MDFNELEVVMRGDYGELPRELYGSWYTHGPKILESYRSCFRTSLLPWFLGGSCRRALVDVKSRVKLYVFFHLAYHIEIETCFTEYLVGGY